MNDGGWVHNSTSNERKSWGRIHISKIDIPSRRSILGFRKCTEVYDMDGRDVGGIGASSSSCEIVGFLPCMRLAAYAAAGVWAGTAFCTGVAGSARTDARFISFSRLLLRAAMMAGSWRDEEGRRGTGGARSGMDVSWGRGDAGAKGREDVEDAADCVDAREEDEARLSKIGGNAGRGDSGLGRRVRPLWSILLERFARVVRVEQFDSLPDESAVSVPYPASMRRIVGSLRMGSRGAPSCVRSSSEGEDWDAISEMGFFSDRTNQVRPWISFSFRPSSRSNKFTLRSSACFSLV